MQRAIRGSASQHFDMYQGSEIPAFASERKSTVRSLGASRATAKYLILMKRKPSVFGMQQR